MKKILITILLLLIFATPVIALDKNKLALVKVWEQRIDLQRVFPNDPYNNPKLEDWARKYGWKENQDLYYYSPYTEIIEKIVDEKIEELRIEFDDKLKERIQYIENNYRRNF